MNLPVYFSEDINNQIQYIKSHNQNNDGYSEWKAYMDWIVHYLSKPSVAWDYAQECVQNENGIIFFDKFGYILEYIIKIDEETSQAYVLIIHMDFKLKNFGLLENKQSNGKRIISETGLREIIAESIRKALTN